MIKKCYFLPVLLFFILMVVFKIGRVAAKNTPEEGAQPPGMVFVKKDTGGFYIDKYLVTQEAYRSAVGSNPSYFKNCPNCPVENVNWEEAANYCKKMGEALPSEEDWQYSATSGVRGQMWPGTNNEGEVGDYAWYSKNSDGKTHPVGQKKPNGLGLYDMSGNAWEWTSSWFDSSKKERVIRGGSWVTNASFLRAPFRTNFAPENRDNGVGFRCAKY
jgi:sulfatase modifying factor 1